MSLAIEARSADPAVAQILLEVGRELVADKETSQERTGMAARDTQSMAARDTRSVQAMTASESGFNAAVGPAYHSPLNLAIEARSADPAVAQIVLEVGRELVADKEASQERTGMADRAARPA